MSSSSRRRTAARRRSFFETLEPRTVMAPLGAFPDDTGEYLLGDVLVTVVLMESDPNLPGADVSTEDWTTESINAVQSKVQDAMNWWKQTLSSLPGAYYNPQLPLLNFKYDWTWALNPVETMFEPINNFSGKHELWVQDFLDQPDVNFAQSLDIYKDVKAFNNFQRERHQTDWAFTMFVVNSTNDTDDFFPLNPSPASGEANYRGAFAFLGGQFLVIPSDRPATSFAHETGHIFYALDEYTGGHSYYAKSGYYNTQNTNAVRDNPTTNFLAQQQPSIMASGSALSQAWLDHVTSSSSRAAVGWQDSDGDGVFDVLDVPFKLSGTGTYNATAGSYRFHGVSQVRTATNQNTFGGQFTNVVYNDISINKIRRAEYKLDDGNWTSIADFAAPGYSQNLDFTIPGISPAAHTLRIRTFDTRTGASSEEFVATINPASQPTPPQYLPGSSGSLAGFLFSDANGNGIWDAGEQAISGWDLQLRNIENQPLTLSQQIEPSDFAENAILNSVEPGITLSVVGATAGGDLVLSRTSSRGAGKVFYAGSSAQETFATIRDSNAGASLVTDRRLRIEFAAPVTSVSLKAISGAVGTGRSVARLLAYDVNNNLIDRYTTGALAVGKSELMTITRTAADIKYVVAVGHLETEVLFDSLSVGPATTAKTNADGSFALHALPPGTYNLQILSAPNYSGVTLADGRFTFTVPSTGSVAGNQYFGFKYDGNPWRNSINPLDVNGVGGVTAFDALMIINYINLHPVIVQLVAGEASPGNYLDVNDDNRCSAFDALAIINYLNLNPVPGGGGEIGSESKPPVSKPPVIELPDTESGLIGTGISGGGGGEGIVAAQSAEEYFAAAPIHVWQRDKDALHDHAHDETDHDELLHDDLFHDEHDESSFRRTNVSGPTQDDFFSIHWRLSDSNLRTESITDAASPLSGLLTTKEAVIAWVASRLYRLSADDSPEDEETSLVSDQKQVRSKVGSLLELLAHDHEQAAEAQVRAPRRQA
jgi:hypothetical protein